MQTDIFKRKEKPGPAPGRKRAPADVQAQAVAAVARVNTYRLDCRERARAIEDEGREAWLAEVITWYERGVTLNTIAKASGITLRALLSILDRAGLR